MERLTNDLFTLEVNTIIKDSIMGTVIPDAGQALVDIVQDYETQLHEFGDKEPSSGSSTVADLDKFDELRKRASEMVKNQEAEETEKLKGLKMNVIGPDNGLKLDAYKAAVNKLVQEKFGAKFGDLYKEIAAIK